jgi:hypothetical protein
MRWLALIVVCLLTSIARAEAPRSPENQVFQFMYSAECTAWRDGSTNKSTVYLWVPEKCERVRGLLILCANVPEHMLVGHETLRDVCRRNDLGIVWAVPSFMNFKKDMPKEYGTIAAFLQQLLDGLAQTSGYDEVATVPWLPIGESGHLLMVDALVEAKPERCIAGVWLKNNHFPPANRDVPALVIYGTSQEWSQEKTDIRTKWNDVSGAYEGTLKRRADSPGWPLSYVIDGHSGHFDCSEQLVGYVSRYVESAAKARLTGDAAKPLKPVDLNTGFVADLPVPGRTASVAKYAGQALPWYFDEALASEAKSITAIDWKAKTQFVGFLDDAGNVRPYGFNGINNIKSVTWEPDGVTFSIRAKSLDAIPAGFVGAGEPLATTPGEPIVEWLCGQLKPVGDGKFRIALDRTYRSGATYLIARKDAAPGVRAIVQPCGVQMNSLRNNDGAAQTITFDAPEEIAADSPPLPLVATASSGLPVEFFVVAGPAKVIEGRLALTEIPPRAKYPVTVTVAAWQWGRATEPKVKTAELVRREIRIVKSK